MKRHDIAFIAWATLAAVYVLVSIGFILAAAYMEVTH